ncbi:MAG: hypothetical protein JWL72_2575 [Ilumatobacteraceae bacterium]|nr:hypothetical protein [Ilumatobacteraceae bacterium]
MYQRCISPLAIGMFWIVLARPSGPVKALLRNTIQYQETQPDLVFSRLRIKRLGVRVPSSALSECKRTQPMRLGPRAFSLCPTSLRPVYAGRSGHVDAPVVLVARIAVDADLPDDVDLRAASPPRRAEAHGTSIRVDGLDLAAGIQPRVRLDVTGAADLVGPPRSMFRCRDGERAHQLLDLVERHRDRVVGSLTKMFEQVVVLRHDTSIACVRRECARSRTGGRVAVKRLLRPYP